MDHFFWKPTKTGRFGSRMCFFSTFCTCRHLAIDYVSISIPIPLTYVYRLDIFRSIPILTCFTQIMPRGSESHIGSGGSYVFCSFSLAGWLRMICPSNCLALRSPLKTGGYRLVSSESTHLLLSGHVSIRGCTLFDHLQMMFAAAN